MKEHIRVFQSYLLQTERSALTIKNYSSDLMGFENWMKERAMEFIDPKVITSKNLRQYVDYLINERELKPKTVNRKLSTLRSFLSWSAKTQQIPPTEIPKSPKSSREIAKTPRWLNIKEKSSLLEAVKKDGCIRDQTIVVVILNTGIRVQELCSLRWRDVKFHGQHSQLSIRNVKGSKERIIPLNNRSREAFKTLWDETSPLPYNFVFLGQRGPITPRGVQFIIKKYAQRIGLENVTPHSLRHTFCRDLINQGVSLIEVSTLAGHKNLNSTRMYCETSIEELRNAVAQLAKEHNDAF